MNNTTVSRRRVTAPRDVRTGAYVRAALAEAGVSEDDAADRIGVSRATLRRELDGRASLSVASVMMISEMLGRGVAAFTGEVLDAAGATS